MQPLTHVHNCIFSSINMHSDHHGCLMNQFEIISPKEITYCRLMETYIFKLSTTYKCHLITPLSPLVYCFNCVCVLLSFPFHLSPKRSGRCSAKEIRRWTRSYICNSPSSGLSEGLLDLLLRVLELVPLKFAGRNYRSFLEKN